MTLAQSLPAGGSWQWLAALAAVAILLSALLVRSMIGLAVMDVPGARSAHERPTPKGGGVGMVAVVLLGTPAALALLPAADNRWPAAILLLSAVLLLGAVSWLDDVRQFGVHAKLAAQVAAAALTVAAVLVSRHALPNWPLQDWPLPNWPLQDWPLQDWPLQRWPLLAIGLPLSLGWLMLTTNAMNFIDGLNGLASGSTTLVCLVGAALGLAFGDPLLFAVMLMTSCGLLGFLPFNYPKARIFLGDVGSQPCGLLVGSLALFILADGGGWTTLLVPLMLAGILCDVVLTLARRSVAGERLTQAHRSHLYQRAARSFMPPAGVSALHWAFVGWGAIAAALLPGRPLAAIVMVAAPQIAWAVRAWR